MTLGQQTVLVRTMAGISVVLLAGGSVAIAGPIGFLGLVVPHAARLLVGTVNLGTGEFPIPPLDVVRAVFGLETASPEHLFVARELRLPRAIVGLLVGAAEILTESLVRDVFDLESRVIPDPATGGSLCIPIGRLRASAVR